MSKTPGDDRPNKKRLDTLIDAASNDTLTEAQRAELERLLLEDDAALAAYVARCQLETALHFEIRSAAAAKRVDAALSGMQPPHAADAVSPRRAEEAAARQWRFRDGALAATAATLLIAAGVFVMRQSVAIAAERQPQPVARLESTDGAKWLGEEPTIGRRFVEGDSIYLTEGLARISMASGAEIALRGPCFVSLDSSMLVRLEEGDLTAQVAEWAHGFTVDTDALRVVDLGTKFAVSTSSQGAAEAHVLDGKVRVVPATKSARKGLLLSGGEALRVTGGATVATKLEADRDRFDAELSDVLPYKPIPLFNTGKGLQPGDEDEHWKIVAGPNCPQFTSPQYAVVCEADLRYLSNEPEHSQWISLTNPARPGAPANTQFTFQTRFNLAGYDLNSVVISAQVIADNGVRAVRINGRDVPVDAWVLNERDQLFNRFHVVEINDGFVEGENVVEFDIWNGVDRYERRDANPLSLRVEWHAFGRPKAEPVIAGVNIPNKNRSEDPSS